MLSQSTLIHQDLNRLKLNGKLVQLVIKMEDKSQSLTKNKIQYQSDDQELCILQSRNLIMEQKPNSRENPSEFMPAYMKEMNIQQDVDFEYEPPYLDHQIMNRLNNLNIQYHPYIFKQVNIDIQQCTAHCTVMEIKVQLGYFTLKISILNKIDFIVQNSTKANIESCLEINGCFGKVIYRYWNRGVIDENNFISKYDRTFNYFVQKVFYFERLSKTEDGLQYCYKKIHNVILEYSFCKIAYGLQIGPQIQLSFGFDLVCYKNGIIFFMERCRTLKNSDYIKNVGQVQKSLKTSLMLLHSLRIIHNDIKFDNIMYSEGLGKIVFIDFGLSEVVKESLGIKTQSLFKGSYYFVSDEMKNLIVKNNGFVDLYWNDLYCLKKSVEFLQDNKKQRGLNQFSMDQSMELNEMYYNENSLAINMSKRRQNPFHDSKEMTQGNSIIPLKQQETLTRFNLAETELLQYQIFYLLYKKKIELFRNCLSTQNGVSQSQRVYLMNLVMVFLEQLKGCPIYDEIYYENYSNFQYNIQYESLRYSSQIIQQPQQQKLPAPKTNIVQKIGNRYLKINTTYGLVSHYIENAWISVFDEISQRIYLQTCIKLRQNKSKSQVDFTEYLQNFNNQTPLVQQNLCNILVYALTIPINQHRQIRKITNRMISMFKSAILKLIEQGFIQQKLNISKNHNQNELTLKKQMIDHIEGISQNEKQGFFHPGKIQNQLQSISYMLVNRLIQNYIFKKQIIRIIEDKKLNLFINPQKIHSTIKNPTASQKIKLLLFLNYCDHYDYKNSYRILQDIKNSFQKKYKIQAEMYCLAVYLRIFNNSISFRYGHSLLTRLKNLTNLFDQSFNTKCQKKKQLRKKTKKIKMMYDFEENQEYLDYFLKYLQLQIMVNKGLSDYNAKQLYQKAKSLQTQSYKFISCNSDKSLKIQNQSQFIILKMMIKDQMHGFQESLQFGKKLFNFYTRGMNDRQVGSKILFRSYFYLGIQQKRVNSSKYLPKVQNGQVNHVQQFKKYSANFQKILDKQKLQIKFVNKYGEFQFQQKLQCINDFNEILGCIKNVDSDVKIFTSQQSLKISMILTSLGVVFRLQLDFLYSIVIQEIKYLVTQQIQTNIKSEFYYQTVLILNQIIEELIILIFEDKKIIPKDLLDFVWSHYREYLSIMFKNNKSLYPTSFWIFQTIIKDRYFELDLNIKKRFGTQMKIIKILDHQNQIQNSYKHLNFVIQFFIKLSDYLKTYDPQIISSFLSNQVQLLEILKKSIRTIVDTKRMYLFLFYPLYTEQCIKILYQNQCFHSIFFICEIMSGFVRNFPGKRNMDAFCEIIYTIQSLNISKQFVDKISKIIEDKILQRQLQAYFPQIVVFLIVLCAKIITLNFNSVLRSDWMLKKITFQFHKLSRYIKKKLFPKYLNLFAEHFQINDNIPKFFQMKLKYIRNEKNQQVSQDFWKKFRNQIHFLKEKINFKNRNRQENLLNTLSHQFHLKLRKLYMINFMDGAKYKKFRLKGFELYE